MPLEGSKAIDFAACHQFVAQNIFKLRPPSYCQDYPKWPGLVGIEIEMLPFETASLATSRPKLCPLRGPKSLSSTLLKLSSLKGWKNNLLEGDGAEDERLLSIDAGGRGMISFEPGGQLEISSIPFPCLSDALSSVKDLQSLLDEALAKDGVTILQGGINPWQTVDEIGLQMTKDRYRAMDKYFTRIGPYGRRMMRQTCTIQINLDFGGDERQLAERYVLGNLLAPFATAIFAYSPYVNRALTTEKSARAEAWRHIDPSRTGVISLDKVVAHWNKDSCVETYLESVLAAPVVFISALGYEVPEEGFSFGDWLKTPYKGVRPTLADFETHLSLHFPEVRARGFLELRSVDAQSRVWQSVPGLFYTSLLYVDATLKKALEYLLPLRTTIDELLIKGTRAGLADETIREASQFLIRLSIEGLNALPSCFQGDKSKATLLAFADHFTERGRSPADDLLDEINNSVDRKFLPATVNQLEAKWRTLVR